MQSELCSRSCTLTLIWLALSFQVFLFMLSFEGLRGVRIGEAANLGLAMFSAGFDDPDAEPKDDFHEDYWFEPPFHDALVCSSHAEYANSSQKMNGLSISSGNNARGHPSCTPSLSSEQLANVLKMG